MMQQEREWGGKCESIYSTIIAKKYSVKVHLSWLNISQNYALVFVLVFLEPSSLETLCQSRFNIFARAHCTFFLLHCATWSKAAAANALCCIFLGNLHWLHSAWLTCLVMCFIKLPAFPFLFHHHSFLGSLL